MPAAPLRPDPSPPLINQRRLFFAVLIPTFSYLFLANAWLGDDAYITFRVIWNWIHGFGMVFNPGERVQAFTHPLWMLLMSGAHVLTREFFFTALAVSYALSLAALLVVSRQSESVLGAAVACAGLLSSKAFVDYTSSGLEYPLSYLLLAAFYDRLYAVPHATADRTRLVWLGALAGLAFVNRMDSILLYVAPLAWLTFSGRARWKGRVLPLALGFIIPAAAWLLFATVYYGFPLPNTYYAKVATGIPAPLLYRQGVAYVLNSISHDPITLGTVAMGLLMAPRARPPIQASVLSALLYVGYTISVGGDFMSGRFFAMPLLVAVMAIMQVAPVRPHLWTAAGVLVLYNVLVPLVPAKTTANYDAAWVWRSQNGIKDERGHYHRATNVLFYSPFRDLPDQTWVREGLSFRQGTDKVTVQGSIGFFGLAAGPDKHLVDRNALSEPLLARLPVSPRLYFEFYSGHFFRDIPEGYIETVAGGQNLIRDPVVHAFYDELVRVLRGPLFTWRRLQSIWYLNGGPGRRFAAQFEQRRAIDLSIRATNERFRVDAGERDEGAGVIRSIGRSGYLQFGPGIPMKRGSYRARWIGTIAGGTTGVFGFVDVWAGGVRLARRDVAVEDIQPESRRIAEISFVLPSNTADLEYRLWIDGRTPVTLERVELTSLSGRGEPQR